MRLLIVDDDPVFREELAELLRDDGHETRVAGSVPVALRELEARDADVVFTDLKMPRHSGLELLKEIRARWPQTLVVMVTGFATVETAIEAMKAGAFDYIRKPFQIAQVRSALELARRQLEFRTPSGRRSDIDRLLREWTTEPGRAVLHLTARAVRPRPQVTVEAPDYDDLSRLRDRIDSFAESHPECAVLLEEADRMFAPHRRGDVFRALEGIAARLEGKGPLVVSFDPNAISAADARQLTGSLVSSETRTTLEALANPVRRAVMERAILGSASFSEAMRAAGVDDSPKLSFHLRRLLDDGLLAHEAEEYRITPRGREAMRLVAEMDAALPTPRRGNAVLPVHRLP